MAFNLGAAASTLPGCKRNARFAKALGLTQTFPLKVRGPRFGARRCRRRLRGRQVSGRCLAEAHGR